MDRRRAAHVCGDIKVDGPAGFAVQLVIQPFHVTPVKKMIVLQLWQGLLRCPVEEKGTFFTPSCSQRGENRFQTIKLGHAWTSLKESAPLRKRSEG